MSRNVFIALLVFPFLIIAAPVYAQSVTGSANVTISAVVPDLAGSPAQVIIPSMASTVMPNMSANVTVTNEGTEDYEYFYEWCVVNNPNDYCGSGNNVFYASASKLIQLGQNWNTVLTATVLSPGTYYFKTTVYFGSNASSASYEFTTTNASGGGGGGNNTTTVTVATVSNPNGTQTGTVVGATAVTNATPIGNITLDTPPNLTVTGPAHWTGDIVMPIATTTIVIPPADTGKQVNVVGSIEVGSGDVPLTFNKAAQLIFAGQAGNLVGYSYGGTFQQITAECVDNTQNTNNLLADGADCTMNVNGDLVVWTKHFSVFTTYTQSTIPPPIVPGGGNNNSGSTGGGGGAGPINNAISIIPISPTKVVTSTIRGDFNNDGKVNLQDLSMLLFYWGKPPPTNNPSIDLGHEGKIGLVDFSILLYLMGNETP
jgi:hypothetical protein